MKGAARFPRKPAMSTRTRFDKKYYERFYGDAKAQAAYRRDEQRLGAFVSAYLNYLGQPVRRVVDIGCGLGQWRDIVSEHFPSATYVGVEQSTYLCGEFGWTEGSVVDYRSEEPFDLVICKDTLQYLSDAKFRRAIDNLKSLCHGVLYVSILTKHDWMENCDRRQTDSRVHLRSGDWYRKAIGRNFLNLGGGLFLSEQSPAIVWDLESLPASRS